MGNDVSACTCDATGAQEFPHRDWCELNHPHHPCDERVCQFADPAVEETSSGV